MPRNSIDSILDRLEQSRRLYGPGGEARLEKLLTLAGQRRFPDAASLVRFHEILLFLRAYPPNAGIVRQAEELLSTFEQRVEQLRSAGEDLSDLGYAEVSGIVGTSISAAFSYLVARWLARHHRAKVNIDWDNYEKKDRMGATWPRFLPLLEEDSLVEANVPYRRWLETAKGRGGQDFNWLIDCFERLSLTEKQKAELYDSLEMPIRWDLGDSKATRTRMRRPVRKLFYHDGPLLKRSDVSLAKEFESPPLPLTKLSPAQGETIIVMAREASVVRYRELYGFTYGDPKLVFRADAGRGVEIFLLGVPSERRLPLRAYHAGFIFKNGVPIGYVEGLTLFERMEIGFNLYYTFRDGESAWLYARILRLFHQTLGVTCFSLDPYQIGFHNEEAIESGAFWFYRKLGFRPAQKTIEKLVENEEKKITAKPGYRSPVRVLRRIAAGYAIFEAPGSPRGDWDNFQIRNVGLAVERRMADRFDGDAERIRNDSAHTVARAVRLDQYGFKIRERRAFESLALVFALIPDLDLWTGAEKRLLAQIVKAKAGKDESQYVRLLQRHARLREVVIRLGSQ